MHQRLKLAMKLDELLRADRKKRAERNWAKANSDAIGIDLDDGDDEEDEGPDHKKGGDSDDEDEDGHKVRAFHHWSSR